MLDVSCKFVLFNYSQRPTIVIPVFCLVGWLEDGGGGGGGGGGGAFITEDA